jgi:hypothetical protein
MDAFGKCNYPLMLDNKYNCSPNSSTKITFILVLTDTTFVKIGLQLLPCKCFPFLVPIAFPSHLLSLLMFFVRPCNNSWLYFQKLYKSTYCRSKCERWEEVGWAACGLEEVAACD